MGLSRKQWLMLIVLVTGSFTTVLNQTLVTPAIPSIMTEMAVDAATAQWLTTGFTLVNAIMIPITAYLQDRFPRRRLFLVCMALFAVGSAMTGFATTFPVMLSGRLLQAAGAGMLMPMTMTVLLVTFPTDKRGSAMGLFGLVIAFAPAIGPTIAGIIIDRLDWHIMFFIVTFFAVVVIVAALFLMEDRPPANKGDAQLDPLSVALSTLGFGLMLYGFSVVGSQGLTLLNAACTVVGIVGVVWFFVRQTRLERPMLRVEVLRNRRFLVATVIGMLVQGALLAAGILMPIYIQTLMGYSATVSGLVLMPGAVLMGIMNPIAGKLFDKHGPRKLGVIGMVLLTITTCGFALLTFATPIWFIAVLYTVRMFSMALVNMPITTWGMNALDNKLMNHGTSVNNTLRQVAGALGTAVIISVSSMTSHVAEQSMSWADAQLLGIDVAFAVCAFLCLIGAALTIALVKDRPADEASEDRAGERRSLLESIMKTDVYAVAQTATVADAMRLFVDKGISAAPVVDGEGRPVGFISDGDILKRLSPRGGQVIDPIVMIMNSAYDERDYNERLEQLMAAPVSEIGARRSIGVSIHASLPEVCRVLAENHLKKVPVMEGDVIVGIINRSDITQYSMQAYLDHRPDEVVLCGDGEDEGACEE
ncbi:MDR family MFS transporter [Adlercreutzia faecimuris]|uniref:MDR family MFS transporter n=1 Tax=Adlercreutzia faecimuris TaxID=2897341 RepID=A0ABS9WFJ3_9ACTN|nr:MDR family MFS transporter [Adlercreutzia sp. JBNU-10]